MFNLDDILRQAQGGGAIDNLARQFGLSPQQAESAVEALLPAFQMGLQRQAGNAQSMGELFGKIASGGFGAAYEDPRAAAAAAGQGNDVLAQLFGSKETSRAVAQHAAAMSGVPATILKSMLPVIASMLIGGMFKNANNSGLGGLFGQLAGALTGGGGQQGGGGLGDLLGQMMGGGQRPQAAPQGGGGLGGGLGDLLGQMMGGGRAPQGGAGGLGPLGDLLGQMMGGAAGGQSPQPRREPQAPPQGGGGLGDILGQVFGGGLGGAMGGGMARAPADADPRGDLPQRRSGVEDEISDMLGGGRGGGAGYDPRRAPPRRPGEESDEQYADEHGREDAAQAQQPSLQDIFGQMFQTGREVQQGQQDALRDIFEQMMGQRRR